MTVTRFQTEFRYGPVRVAGHTFEESAWCHRCGKGDRSLLSFDITGGEFTPTFLCETCVAGFFRYLDTDPDAHRPAPEGVER